MLTGNVKVSRKIYAALSEPAVCGWPDCSSFYYSVYSILHMDYVEVYMTMKTLYFPSSLGNSWNIIL